MTTTLGARVGLDHEEELRREYPALLAFCRTLDWDSPEDLAQEAVARTLPSLAAGRVERLGPYLHTTARNVRADLVRSKFAHPVVLTGDVATVPVEDRDVVQDIANHEGLLIALSHLNDRELAVLCLAEIDQRSLDDIASVVGCTPSGVKSVLYRARQKARTEVARLKQRGLLAVAGPLGPFRSLFSEAGGALVAGGATAVIAVAATLGVLGGPDGTRLERAAGAVAAEGRPGGVAAPPPGSVLPALEAAPPAPAAPARNDRRGPAGPATPASPAPGRRPVERPQRPEPWVKRDKHDRTAERDKPIYVAAPDRDLDCDGQPDPAIIVSDDPWAEEGRPVFGGSPPSGAGGQLVHVDLARMPLPSGCPAQT